MRLDTWQLLLLHEYRANYFRNAAVEITKERNETAKYHFSSWLLN